MERLTERDPYWLGEEFWTSAREPEDEEIDAVYERLKHYEDLEELLEKTYGKCDGLLEMAVKYLAENEGVRDENPKKSILLTDEDAEKWFRWKESEADGKLIALPCNLGDTVYYIYMDCPPDYEEVYCIDHQGGCENCHHRVPTIMSKKYTLDDIDMPVYLTEQEAKKALEGMKE